MSDYNRGWTKGPDAHEIYMEAMEAKAQIELAKSPRSAPTVKLSSGQEVLEYILCDKCGKNLHISPNTKGAFSYQGCDCHEDEKPR